MPREVGNPQKMGRTPAPTAQGCILQLMSPGGATFPLVQQIQIPNEFHTLIYNPNRIIRKKAVYWDALQDKPLAPSPTTLRLLENKFLFPLIPEATRGHPGN